MNNQPSSSGQKDAPVTLSYPGGVETARTGRDFTSSNSNGPSVLAAPITTRPVIRVDTSERLRHTISIADESAPTSQRRPESAVGFELWVKVGRSARVSRTGWECLGLIGLITRRPDLEEYEPAQGGQPARYIARWVNEWGQKGPLSEPVMATIAA
jgi:hypothetical protein